MTSFEIVTAKGAVICTFDTRKAATDWLASKRDPDAVVSATWAEVYPGWKLQEVTRTEARRTIWSDRSHLRLIERLA